MRISRSSYVSVSTEYAFKDTADLYAEATNILVRHRVEAEKAGYENLVSFVDRNDNDEDNIFCVTYDMPGTVQNLLDALLEVVSKEHCDEESEEPLTRKQALKTLRSLVTVEIEDLGVHIPS